MGIQQMMITQRIAPASVGLSPTEIGTTPTFWYDGDNSPHWKGDSTSSGASSSNNDAMLRSDSVAGATIRCFSGVTATRKIPVSASNNGFYHPELATSAAFSFYTRPTGTASPSVVSTLAAMFTAALKTMIFAVRIDDCVLDSGLSYGNARIMGDGFAYAGLHCFKSGSNLTFQAYNYSGAEQFAAATITGGIGSWAVVAMKHSGGQLRIYVNGVQVGSPVASGNTDVTTGTMLTGGQSLISLAQFATYNADISDANILQVSRYFGARVGVVI